LQYDAGRIRQARDPLSTVYQRFTEGVATRDLQQVLLNLITNAVDSMAAPDGGDRVLRVRSDNDMAKGVTISVEDNGRGVEPRHMDQIFNPLFTTKTQGMGMGLAICRSIVEAHDGRLWATPNRPRGAVFQFSLPAITP
jgi:signal transduction histidine kinase